MQWFEIFACKTHLFQQNVIKNGDLFSVAVFLPQDSGLFVRLHDTDDCGLVLRNVNP